LFLLAVNAIVGVIEVSSVADRLFEVQVLLWDVLTDNASADSGKGAQCSLLVPVAYEGAADDGPVLLGNRSLAPLAATVTDRLVIDVLGHT